MRRNVFDYRPSCDKGALVQVPSLTLCRAEAGTAPYRNRKRNTIGVDRNGGWRPAEAAGTLPSTVFSTF